MKVMEKKKDGDDDERRRFLYFSGTEMEWAVTQGETD